MREACARCMLPRTVPLFCRYLLLISSYRLHHQHIVSYDVHGPNSACARAATAFRLSEPQPRRSWTRSRTSPWCWWALASGESVPFLGQVRPRHNAKAPPRVGLVHCLVCYGLDTHGRRGRPSRAIADGIRCKDDVVRWPVMAASVFLTILHQPRRTRPRGRPRAAPPWFPP